MAMHLLLNQALGNFFCWQRFEQYKTLPHTFRHFLRQLNGRRQTGQILVGKSDFLIMTKRLETVDCRQQWLV
jgi:hypothetical protein